MEFESEAARLMPEIERLNNTLRVKIQQSQEWQEKYTQISTRFTGAASEFDKLQAIYNHLLRDSELSKRRSL